VRESGFFRNPRFAPAGGGPALATASLRLCAEGQGCTPADGAADGRGKDGGAEGKPVSHPGKTGFGRLAAVLARARDTPVLHVRGVGALELSDAPSSVPPLSAIEPLGRGHWCNPCPITRKAAGVQVGTGPRRQLEQFCRAEARGAIGTSPHRTCCAPDERGCRRCGEGEKAPLNPKALAWPVSDWLRGWASLQYPAEFEAVKETWQCSHPYCTGRDRKAFP